MVPGRGGDEETFEEFTARSVEHLTRLGYLLSGDHRRLVRDCLAEVRRTWPRADATRVLVARFLARPGAEPGRQPDPLVDVDVDTDLVADLAGDPGPGDDRHEREALWWALGALPPRQRAAVVLRYWAGLSVAEVATVLDCPERVVATETGQGIAGVVAAAAELTAGSGTGAGEPTVAGEDRGHAGERDAEAVLAAGLRILAAAAPPLGVPVDEMLATADPAVRSRRRWLSVALAVVVLAGAGAVAATLRTEPADETEGLGWVEGSDPATGTTGRPQPSLVELGPVVVDDQARKLTRQLRAAMGQVLPGATLMHPVARPPGADEPPASLEFHTFDAPEVWAGYMAYGIIRFREVALTVSISVQQRSRSELSSYAPCPEIELDCTFRQFPDRTRADVIVYTDPASRTVSHALTSARPDGTFFHVELQPVDPGTPPAVGVEDLFRFARVFTY